MLRIIVRFRQATFRHVKQMNYRINLFVDVIRGYETVACQVLVSDENGNRAPQYVDLNV